MVFLTFNFSESFGFEEYKNGESLYFPQTALLIVPDQKETAGALNAAVLVVEECVKMLSWSGWGACTCRNSDAQVSRDQRVRV